MSKKANRLLKRIGERFARPFLSKPKAPPEQEQLVWAEAAVFDVAFNGGGIPDIQVAEVYVPAGAVITGAEWRRDAGLVVHTNNGVITQYGDGAAAPFDVARLQQARLQLQAAAMMEQQRRQLWAQQALQNQNPLAGLQNAAAVNEAQFAQEVREYLGRGQVGMQVPGPPNAGFANSMRMRGEDVFGAPTMSHANSEWWLPTDPKAEVVRIKQMVVDEETLLQPHVSGLRMDAIQYRSAPWEAQDRRDRLSFYVDGSDGPGNKVYRAFSSTSVKGARFCLEVDGDLHQIIVEFALGKNHAIVIDSSEYGRLISVPVCMGYRRILYVHVKNSTSDKDGKYADYYIPVDLALRPITAGGFGEPQMEYTAKNAIASTFGLRGEDYDVRAAS